jgi:hypothetical protein
MEPLPSLSVPCQTADAVRAMRVLLLADAIGLLTDFRC